MREKLLIKLAALHTDHPWRMTGVVLFITLILAMFAGQLTVTMRTQDLLPKGDPKLDQFNLIIDEFASATSIIVVVQGDEARIKNFANDLAPQILSLRDTTQNLKYEKELVNLKQKLDKLESKGLSPEKLNSVKEEIDYARSRINRILFQRVDYKTETEFLRNHALMLVKAEDLRNTKDLFTDPNLTGLITNINNSMEKEYVGQEESISTREKEDGAVGFLDGIENLIIQMQNIVEGNIVSKDKVHAAADKFLFGEPYMLSYDKSTLILNVIPNFTILDRDILQVGVEAVQVIVDELLKKYPDVEGGLSGDIARERDEQVYSEQSLQLTTFIAFGAILLMLILSFRMWVAPIFAVINLFLGLLWAMGVAFLAVGQLNMMTAMLSVVLLGLGIDFSIHLLSGFTEFRALGNSIHDSLEKTFLKSGKGIITGALTTACAFLALLISQSRGMKEMGIVTGAGLLSVLVATFLILPIMLVFREKRIENRLEKLGQPSRVRRDISFRPLGNISMWLSKKYGFTLLCSVLVTGFLVTSGLQIKYDQNYLSMEPKGLRSIALMDTIMDKFDLSMEYALYLAESVDESREMAKRFKDLGTVAMTNDISVHLPSEEEQKERFDHIMDIRKSMKKAIIKHSLSQSELARFIKEIERLEMNVIEIQDMAFLGGQDKVDNKCQTIVGDPDHPETEKLIQNFIQSIRKNNRESAEKLSLFQRTFAPYFKKCVQQMCSTDPITLNDLPESILNQYSNEALDKFMITIFPSGQLFTDARVLNRFVDDMDRVSEKTTGSPPVAVVWMRIAARDGRNAILLTLFIVFCLLWIDFRKPWYALMAMVPLAAGVFWMVGIMQISGLLLNFMTMMGLPLIIGIGIDDGVHVMHRWQSEGRGKVHTVFSSTGKAILLTSLTTMLAFGSMIFSVFPAWMFFGLSLFIGVGVCFLTTVIILSGIIGLIEKYGKRR